LLLCYLAFEKSITYIEKKTEKNNFDILHKNIYEALSVLNWNKARYLWLSHNESHNGIKTKTDFYGNIYYNCMESEYTAYYSTYADVQEFEWTVNCPRKNCIVNKKTVMKKKGFNFEYKLLFIEYKLQFY
jgi:hypothetical protein